MDADPLRSRHRKYRPHFRPEATPPEAARGFERRAQCPGLGESGGEGTGEQGMRPPQMRLGPAEGQLRPFTDGQIREPEPGTRRRVV